MEDHQADMDPFKGGAPFKFDNADSLKIAVQAYFDSCDPHVVQQVVETGINKEGETIWAKRAVMNPQRPTRRAA